MTTTAALINGQPADLTLDEVVELFTEHGDDITAYSSHVVTRTGAVWDHDQDGTSIPGMITLLGLVHADEKWSISVTMTE